MSNKTLLIALLLFLVNCNSPTPKKELVFSCICCKGCVIQYLSHIEKNRLDTSFQVILDSTCIGKLYPLDQLHFQHSDQATLFQKYGEFGNLLYFDSTGKRMEFLTDMKLSDVLKAE